MRMALQSLLRFGPAAIYAAMALATTSVLADAILSHRDDLTPKDSERVARVTAPARDFTKSEPFEAMSAGATTSRATANRDAFSHSLSNLPFKGEEDFKLGNALFRKQWVSSPSSTQASDGLGPLFNARACQNCHLKDGRGRPPEAIDEQPVSLFLRLAIPPRNQDELSALADKTLLRIPEPTYGGQFQNFAVPGVPPEGRVTITYDDVPVELAGGETVSLRQPTYGVTDLAYGPIATDVQLSPRLTPQMIGVGLLEAIHPGDILALADPDDVDGDGVSGRVSMVRDHATSELVLGRFGWKASNATVRDQVADAFSGDIGISTPLAADPFGDCTDAQTRCRTAATGIQDRLGPFEAPDPVLDLVTFYSRNLAVPARRDIDDPAVLKGKSVFYAAGCAACHTPKFVTSREAGQAEHRFQLIWPYTDMLLHDMGEGLADGSPVGDASGSEWRTPPLWGIGLTDTVSGTGYYLHDGRARSLLEAIVWHGGEAKAARDRIVAATPDDRRALIRFLESL
jgi:CxxC motif-containing protein (DUF1111 family)